MSKKEFKVGEVFQCGLIKLKCVERKFGASRCNGCFFDEKDFICVCKNVKDITGECGGKREDETDVIFVKVEE